MKTIIVTLSIVSLLLLPLAAYTEPVTAVTVTSSEEGRSAPPPISQPLVREGDFAINLVSALNLGTATGGADAENILASAGIAPKNGWISDYPVTPVVIGQLQQSIETAASAGTLPMGSSRAISAFQTLVADEGLPIQVAPGASPAEGTKNYGEYSNPSVINNYYYNEGPPVVTYYAPPPAYAYLYAWVPFPFWWAGFWFPGYYCLHDFDVAVFVHHHRRVLTNHFYNPATRRFVRINPGTLAFERGFHSDFRGGPFGGFRQGFHEGFDHRFQGRSFGGIHQGFHRGFQGRSFKGFHEGFHGGLRGRSFGGFHSGGFHGDFGHSRG
jgi:hypothetical protein